MSTAKSRRVYEKVLDVVEYNTGGEQAAMMPRTTVRLHLGHADIRGKDAKKAIRAAIENRALFHWKGKVAVADVESLREVVAEEAASDVPRKQLIGKANARIQELQEGDDE